jgi:hypothetical protein
MLSFFRGLTTVFLLVSEFQKNYLENKRQRIKSGNNYSEWDTLIKGVPQAQS